MTVSPRFPNMEQELAPTVLPDTPKREEPPQIEPHSSSLLSDRESTCIQHSLLQEALDNVKRRKVDAKASRDSMKQINDLRWWTQEKLVHQASMEQLETEIQIQKTTPSKKSQAQVQAAISQLEAALDHELAAERNSRKEEIKKDMAFLEAAKLEGGNIEITTLSQSTNSFLSLITETIYPQLSSSKQRSNDDRRAWKTALIIRYNLMEDHSPSQLITRSYDGKTEQCLNKSPLWCPVLQVYRMSTARTAAHIVPHRLGQTAFELIFGKDSDGENRSTWSLRDGMLLSTEIERMFDEGTIVITPRSSAPSDNEFETRVLNRTKRNDRLSAGVPGCEYVRDLHKRKLVFKNSERPGRRCLYFMYCMALYNSSQRGGMKVVQAELSGDKDIWATPGPYIRANMLRTLAADMGHDISFLHPDRHSIKENLNSSNDGVAEISHYYEAAQFWQNDIDEDEDPKEFPIKPEMEAYEFLRKDAGWRKYDQ